MHRWRWLLPCLLLVISLCRASPVAAGDGCPPYSETVSQLDYLLEGRIKFWPIPGLMYVTVDRYYIGSGQQTMVIDGDFASWKNHIMGSPATRTLRVFGLAKGTGSQLVRGYCAPWESAYNSNLQRLLESLGPGTAPLEGYAYHTNFFRRLALEVMVVGSLIWSWHRWRRRSTHTSG